MYIKIWRLKSNLTPRLNLSYSVLCSNIKKCQVKAISVTRNLTTLTSKPDRLKQPLKQS